MQAKHSVNTIKLSGFVLSEAADDFKGNLKKIGIQAGIFQNVQQEQPEVSAVVTGR